MIRNHHFITFGRQTIASLEDDDRNNSLTLMVKPLLVGTIRAQASEHGAAAVLDSFFSGVCRDTS